MKNQKNMQKNITKKAGPTQRQNKYQTITKLTFEHTKMTSEQKSHCGLPTPSPRDFDSYVEIGKRQLSRRFLSRTHLFFKRLNKGECFAPFNGFRRHQRHFFIKFSIFEISGSMTPKLGLTKLRRYAFVWRYDTTNRKPHVRKQWEKYGWAKRTHRFREIRGWTTRWP